MLTKSIRYVEYIGKHETKTRLHICRDVFFAFYSLHIYTPDIRSFRFSVRPFVRLYVRSFVRLSVTGSKFLR